MKEKDGELVRVIRKCSVLEGALREKEEELEVSNVPTFKPKWSYCTPSSRNVNSKRTL